MQTPFFTGKGDEGSSFFGSCKMEKSDPLFLCLGDLDELNSWLGFCAAVVERTAGVKSVPVDIAATLRRMQELLFVAQAEVAFVAGSGGRKIRMTSEQVRFLEDVIGRIDRVLPPLTQFVVPGGSEIAAALDVARAVARRVERSFIAYPKRDEFSDALPAFLNRVSSALFALARYANFDLDHPERHPSYR